LNKSQNIGNKNKVKKVLYPILEKEIVKSEKLISSEKNKKLANINATKKVNQSDAIVVLTLLFLT
tara:strand:+ start:751 stop:945 length:195 start_codon:yes stop_codon:yes gene_type:complete